MGLFTTTYKWLENPDKGAAQDIYQRQLDLIEGTKNLSKKEREMRNKALTEGVFGGQFLGMGAKALAAYKAEQQSTGDASLDAARAAKFAGQAQLDAGIAAQQTSQSIWSQLTAMKNQNKWQKRSLAAQLANQQANALLGSNQMVQQGPLFDLGGMAGSALGAWAGTGFKLPGMGGGAPAGAAAPG